MNADGRGAKADATSAANMAGLLVSQQQQPQPHNGAASLFSDPTQIHVNTAQRMLLLSQPDPSSAWEAMFQGLVSFQRQHNSLAITRRDYVEGKSLYEWTRNQRKHYLNGLRGKTPVLSEVRMQRLQCIGFDLNPTGVLGQNDAVDDKRWAAMLKGLTEFKDRHGSFCVPRGHLVNGRSLHDWMRHQRTQFANSQRGLRPALSVDRRDRLESIGFDLDPTGRRQDNRSKEERWDVMFQGLVNFKQKFGTVTLPEACYHDGRSLFSWAHHQRRMYANRVNGVTPYLSEERLERLKSIGFDFSSKMIPSASHSHLSEQSVPSSPTESRAAAARAVKRPKVQQVPSETQEGTSLHRIRENAEDEQAVLAELARKALIQYQTMLANHRQ
jgi:hypothetical protein